jgi:cytochrome c oxidase subunit 3
MAQAAQSQEEINLKEKVNRNLLYIGIFSSLMLFAGLTSAYIVRQADGGWNEFNMPFIFWVSTAIILVSSVSMNIALISAKNDRPDRYKPALLITFILGLAFCATQIIGWGQLVDGGVYFTGRNANPSGSYFYILSGVHLAHIASALIYLLVILFNAFKNKYNSNNYAGIRHSGIFWHFLDGVWVYVFIFLIFMQ